MSIPSVYFSQLVCALAVDVILSISAVAMAVGFRATVDFGWSQQQHRIISGDSAGGSPFHISQSINILQSVWWQCLVGEMRSWAWAICATAVAVVAAASDNLGRFGEWVAILHFAKYQHPSVSVAAVFGRWDAGLGNRRLYPTAAMAMVAVALCNLRRYLRAGRCFAFCKITISLIAAAEGSMFELGFVDVHEMLYLVAGDGFACMLPAWRQPLGLLVFLEIRKGKMVICEMDCERNMQNFVLCENFAQYQHSM